MDMPSIFVGGDQDFKAMEERKAFRQFMRYFICQLRSDLFIRSEGLDKMLVGPSTCFVIELFGHCHFLPDRVGIAVETVQQNAFRLLFFHDIIQGSFYSRVGRYSFNNCHRRSSSFLIYARSSETGGYPLLHLRVI